MQNSQNGSTTNSTIRVSEGATSSSPPSTTITTAAIIGGGVPACASCRHQRKKCSKKCVLAPFFPAEKTQDFQAVQRLFGVSNLTKLVKNLSKEDGKKAVDLLIWEANCRLNEPVLGPFGEFLRVSEELKFYKTQHQQYYLANNNIHHNAALYNNNNNNKSAQKRMIGSWNGDNRRFINYIHVNSVGGSVDNGRMFKYESLQNMERLKQETDEQQGSLIRPQQKETMNDFSQFYN